jgi:hypothetical protein
VEVYNRRWGPIRCPSCSGEQIRPLPPYMFYFILAAAIAVAVLFYRSMNQLAIAAARACGSERQSCFGHHSKGDASMTKMYPLLLALTVSFLMAPIAAQAQPWTGAAGTGVVDESALGIYQADVATIGYNASGSTSTIVIYYNVTDTTGTGNPPWTTLELRYYDVFPDSSVRAQLIRMSGGVKSTVLTCGGGDSNGGAVVCPLNGQIINFNSGNLYAIVVTISRSSASSTPIFMGARLY